MSSGYWRISPYSTKMLACPWPHACQGGDGSNATAPATTNGRRLSPALALTDVVTGCSSGYAGPLCATCAHNYYFSSTTTTCEACGNNGNTQMSLMFVIPALMIVVVVAVYILFVKFGQDLADGERTNKLAAMAGGAEVESESDEEEGGQEGNMDGDSNVAVLTLFDGLKRRLKGVGKRIKSQMKLFKPLIEFGSAVVGYVGNLDQDLLMPMVKIMMTVFQIVSGMPNAIDLKFPPHAARMFEVFAFVNFTSMNFGSPQCYYKYDYVDVLMLQTLAPLALIALLFLAYLVDHRCRATPIGRSVYVTFFFLITYLVLPRYSLLLAHSFVHDTTIILFVYFLPPSTLNTSLHFLYALPLPS